MIEGAQRKLREAQFFYNQLVGASGEPFRFYFSAFIQAARAVTWIMKSEEPDKYEKWLPTWEARLGEDDRQLERVSNELRLDEAKRGGATILIEWAWAERVIDPQVEKSARYAAELFMRRFNVQRDVNTHGVNTRRDVKTYQPRHLLADRSEVTSVCKQYLSYLERKIQTFLSEHASA
jgi:hypothetical protein